MASVTLLPLFFFLAPWQESYLWAAFLDIFVVLLCLTDFLDGRLARMMKTETIAGRVFDPVADKVLVVTMFLILFAAGRTDVLLVAVVIIRELLVMGLREFALIEGIPVLVSSGGKAKTAVQMLYCLFQVINPSFYENGFIFFSKIEKLFVIENLLSLLILYLTIKSALDYFQTFFFSLKKKKNHSL